MRYIVQVIPLEGHPGQVGFETRVTCPDGRVVLTRKVGYRELISQIVKDMTEQLASL